MELLTNAIAPGQHVLELGCEYRTLTAALADREPSITPADTSVAYVRQAARKVEFEHVKFLTLNPSAMPFKTDNFDLAGDISFIYRCRPGVRTQLARALRPGGRALFAEPNLLNPHIATRQPTRLRRDHYQKAFGWLCATTFCRRDSVVSLSRPLTFSTLGCLPSSLLWGTIGQENLSGFHCSENSAAR
ncbi:MAG: class I SAM-dependent methyltransferase [Polyangiaceae bacterium]|nr:class I SAM-dependent methyltransferase [Polyangiaceae bacterium]